MHIITIFYHAVSVTDMVFLVYFFNKDMCDQNKFKMTNSPLRYALLSHNVIAKFSHLARF